jgi:hypothetical protein
MILLGIDLLELVVLQDLIPINSPNRLKDDLVKEIDEGNNIVVFAPI